MRSYSVSKTYFVCSYIPLQHESWRLWDRAYYLTGHLHFLTLFSSDSNWDAFVFTFKLFLTQSCMIPCGAALIPQKAMKIKANLLWKQMPCEEASVYLAAWQIHSSCSQKVLCLVRSHSQKLASWILTEEPLHKSDVTWQDRELPSASGRMLTYHLSLFKYSQVVSLQYIVIIDSKHCYISFSFLQRLMGLTPKANEVSKESSWALDCFRHRKGWRWLTALCNAWLHILSWLFAAFLRR